ncbi:class I SAM-dependent methyltransferase [Lysobacter antibioticus]|uniref:class I SAM-dependent methyltransferase n=1 Tax=Lysobacter antibioticus TaxID=84531 RepID=UPI0009EBAD88|nr:class I SAM-dependent methyltransferase [Lysobacter antibioticus]
MNRLRALAAPLLRTPLHPQWLLGGRKAPLGIKAVVGRVLDVGAGDRWIAAHLGSRSEYIALDYPATGRDLYRAKPDVFADAANLPFADGTFDAVICLEVLEHVRNPQGVLDEIGRVLRADGVVWLSMPFLYPIHDAPHDYQRFTVHGLKRSVEASGLSLCEVEKTQHALCTAGLLVNLGIVGAIQNSASWKRLVLIPLAMVAIVCINLGSWLASKLWPDWEALTAGYVLRATKR